MTRLIGQKFVNASTCSGVSFSSPDSPIDLAEINISGRYPILGWARNIESHEIVRILRGKGELLMRDGDTIQLSENDVVHIKPNQWFAWNGKITLLMSCSPAFSIEQYEIEEG